MSWCDGYAQYAPKLHNMSAPPTTLLRIAPVIASGPTVAASGRKVWPLQEVASVSPAALARAFAAPVPASHGPEPHAALRTLVALAEWLAAGRDPQPVPLPAETDEPALQRRWAAATRQLRADELPAFATAVQQGSADPAAENCRIAPQLALALLGRTAGTVFSRRAADCEFDPAWLHVAVRYLACAAPLPEVRHG